MSGRPSSYSEKIVERILSGLIEGQSLVKICEAEDMPNRRTVLRWMEDNEEFATKCARARVLQADLMDDKIIDLIESVTPESAPADRIKLAALQWRAAKLLPKKYGEKVTTEHTGPDGGPVVSMPDLAGALLSVLTRSRE
jgi:predicted methyltransferase